MSQTTIVVLGGTSITTPSDCTSWDLVVCVGAGQNNVVRGKSGDGGAYAVSTDVPATPNASIPISVGGPGDPGGDTSFNSGQVLAPGGGSSTTAVGDVVSAGGAGHARSGPPLSPLYFGGGGAGGPDGAGQDASGQSGALSDAGAAGRASLWTDTLSSTSYGAGDGGDGVGTTGGSPSNGYDLGGGAGSGQSQQTGGAGAIILQYTPT